jgi:hypothetical protein
VPENGLDSGAWYITCFKPEVVSAIDGDSFSMPKTTAELAKEENVTRGDERYQQRTYWNRRSHRVYVHDQRDPSVKTNFLLFIALFAVSAHAYCNSNVPSRTRYFNLSVQSETESLHCLIDEKPIDATLSSDGEAVIVSGTAYVPVAELSHCKADVPIHVRRAAPHVGFLSDINIKAGIYASMVPVSVSPMVFLEVAAKIGSDRNLVKNQVFIELWSASPRWKRRLPRI